MVIRQETNCHQQLQHMTQYSKSIWCFSKVTSGDCPLKFKTELEGPEKDCTPHDAASAYSPSTHPPPAKKIAQSKPLSIFFLAPSNLKHPSEPAHASRSS
jgi:hypothetical protein